MLRKILYAAAVIYLMTNISYSQKKDEKISTQTDKQKSNRRHPFRHR
jgi:hypothetical protein